MAIKHHFFPITVTTPSFLKNTSAPQAGFTDVGDKKDCGFRAIAAGLVDLLSRHHLIKGKELLLTTILTRHESLFKYTSDSATLSTASQKIQKLITKIPLNQLITELAYTLRQIAVDELCANPTLYPDAFIDHPNHSSSPEHMRHPESWINESSLLALSNRLRLPITIHVVTSENDLPKIIHYHSDKSMPCVLIKQNKTQYMPYLHLLSQHIQAKHDHNPLEQHPIQTTDPRLNEIRALIAEQGARMRQTFESICTDLKKNLEAGVLSKAALLAIYVHGIKDNDCLEAHGAQPIIADFKSRSLELFAPVEHTDFMIEPLVHAIASAISIGRMSRHALYRIYDETAHKNTHAVSLK
jgi:hypothetical protein